MVEDYAIRIEGLGKKFSGKNQDDFWALSDVDLEIKKGEVIAIIGKNGAGKSTLLSILSGVLKPTTGRITINGRITGILEIGTGFHPDLTGRENVYLNGELNGVTRKSVDAVFNELLEFSELKDFIEKPVKTYSSGMLMRLAFSVFAFLNPEILLLDEVFSVGDAAFQKKCLEKIRELIGHGTTVVLVAHNMNDVTNICKRACILQEGKVIMHGKAFDVVQHYLERILLDNFSDKPLATVERKEFVPGEANNGSIELKSAEVRNAIKGLGRQITREDEIEIELRFAQTDISSTQILLSITNASGVIVLMDSYGVRKDYVETKNERGIYAETVVIPGSLLNKGLYFVNFMLGKNLDTSTKAVEVWNVLSFKIELNDWEKDRLWSLEIDSVLRPDLKWKSERIS